jgi:hypothetical protein
LKPEYERLAGILKGMVNVAAVDVDQYKSLGGRFGIQGFPTIKIFNIDKQKPEDYQGERTSGAMLECGAQHVGPTLVPFQHLKSILIRGITVFVKKPSKTFWLRVSAEKPKRATAHLLPKNHSSKSLPVAENPTRELSVLLLH